MKIKVIRKSNTEYEVESEAGGASGNSPADAVGNFAKSHPRLFEGVSPILLATGSAEEVGANIIPRQQQLGIEIEFTDAKD